MSERKRVVIVGGSTGLGRSIGIGLAQRGAHVALIARTQAKLDSAIAEAGNDAVAIPADATDPESAKAGIEAAAAALGGIDTLLYAAAVGPIARIEEATAEQWQNTFATNVIGASLTTAAALPYVKRSNGNVLYMSTTGASFTPPWPGLSIYQVTKAALDRLVESWRAEHPAVNFTRVTIGECAGGEGDAQTQFTSGWDMSLVGEFATSWITRNFMNMAFIDVGHLTDTFFSLVTAGPSMQIPAMTIIPRPANPDAEENMVADDPRLADLKERGIQAATESRS